MLRLFIFLRFPSCVITGSMGRIMLPSRGMSSHSGTGWTWGTSCCRAPAWRSPSRGSSYRGWVHALILWTFCCETKTPFCTFILCSCRTVLSLFLMWLQTCCSSLSVLFASGSRCHTLFGAESGRQRRYWCCLRTHWHGQIPLPWEEASCLRHRRGNHKTGYVQVKICAMPM